jgi:uncharacterized CHY-type Zn-finger protein
VSLSPSRSVSPITPNDGSRSPFGRLLRSATAPLQSPPSPEGLTSNLDNPFPPFPPTRSATKSRQETGGYGGFGIKPTTLDPMYAPVSPRTATSGGLLQRANTIAPGPFDINGGGQKNDSLTERGHMRQRSLKLATMSSRTAAVPENMPRPSTASGDSASSSPNPFGSKPGIPRVPRNNGYGGFGPPVGNDSADREPVRLEARSQTFPLQNGEEPAYRKPLEPDSRMRRPSNEPGGRRPSINGRAVGGSPDAQRKPLVGPDLSRPLPPRGASLSRSRTAAGPGDTPPIPSNLNLAAEFGIGNPYHTPTESQSSATSGSSQESKASSRSSPPRSAAPDRSPWRIPDTSKNPMSDTQALMTDLQVRGQTPHSPPRNKEHSAQAPIRELHPSLVSSESQFNPAIQEGLASQPPPRNPARSQTPSSPGEKPIRRRTTKKGNCKGCGVPITGKSVSSADGRLTGRYHKECFVCTTCSEPFQTSTFYVINDAPYCERHYHKLNGSVCTTCDRGIEGQYLESQRKQKFHPGCLTCSDCKKTLRNEYFEMGGMVYCERDAFRRTQQGRLLGPGAGGSNRMQRRTTRLMMM